MIPARFSASKAGFLGIENMQSVLLYSIRIRKKEKRERDRERERRRGDQAK
jgi:hypothetical protein